MHRSLIIKLIISFSNKTIEKSMLIKTKILIKKTKIENKKLNFKGNPFLDVERNV